MLVDTALPAEKMVRNPVRCIQRHGATGNHGAQVERWRKPLLTCGILAGTLYVAMTLLVGMLWDGYSNANQTISELSAINAPTRPLWVVLGTIYSALMIAFGWIVWKSAPYRKVRIVGALLFTQAMFGMFWPPMHQRAVLAAGGGTLTDTLHIVWTIVTSLFFMSALGVGAAGFGKRFRFYSIGTMAIVFACGAWTGTYAPALQRNLPTPWVGVWERVNTHAFMLWIAVLAVTLLHVPQPRDDRPSRLSGLERAALIGYGSLVSTRSRRTEHASSRAAACARRPCGPDWAPMPSNPRDFS